MDKLDPSIAKELKNESLRYVSDIKPGFFRMKNRNIFTYYDKNGSRIKDEKTLERIKKLVIPPAWKKVWIAPYSNAHLQATGVDDKGRKQYIYHETWTKIAQENKFSRLVDFGVSLPKVREKVRYDLSLEGMDKRKIIATVIWLLEHTFIRIGNEEYQKENNSFGLTTLRNKHAVVRGNDVLFKFRGKHGVESIIEVSNKQIAKTIRKCIELPGYELFQYIDEDNNRHVVDSEDVNLFLKEITGEDFTAKDYRTWGGTHLASTHLYKIGDSDDQKTIAKNVRDTIKEVSQHLNNTVSVCRNYYIHPAVVRTYTKKILVNHFNKHKENKSNTKGLKWDENALVNLLQKYS